MSDKNTFHPVRIIFHKKIKIKKYEKVISKSLHSTNQMNRWLDVIFARYTHTHTRVKVNFGMCRFDVTHTHTRKGATACEITLYYIPTKSYTPPPSRGYLPHMIRNTFARRDSRRVCISRFEYL